MKKLLLTLILALAVLATFGGFASAEPTTVKSSKSNSSDRTTKVKSSKSNSSDRTTTVKGTKSNSDNRTAATPTPKPKAK